MDKTEKAKALLERAERLGLRLDCESGLILVRRAESGDPERQDDLIAELGKCMGDVHRLVQQRAIGVHAQELVGQRIWSEDGEGVLASASVDGQLTITIVNAEFRQARTVMSRAEDLLIILEQDRADGAVSPNPDEPKSDRSRRGLFDVLRRSPRKD